MARFVYPRPNRSPLEEARMALARQAQAGESWGVQLPTQAFVDGRYVDAQAGGTLPCVFPGNGRTIGHVAACETADVDAAVSSARKAFESGAWSRMAPQDRRKVLLKLSELILHNRDELATLETLNVGKPLVNAKTGDIPSAAACIGWFGEAIDKIYGEVGPTPHDLTAVITREPLGVVAAAVELPAFDGRVEAWPGAGGRQLRRADGFFIEPTVFDGVSNDMKIAQEEIFGPVLS